MRDADRAGSRGDMRRVVKSLFSGCCCFPEQTIMW